MEIFDTDYESLPIALCYEYLRAQGGPHASLVVKAAAERACLQSMSLGILLLCALSFCFASRMNWIAPASITVVGLVLSIIALKGAERCEKQLVERIVAGLLIRDFRDRH